MSVHLLAPPSRFRHKPTEIEAMQFTPGSRAALEAWLTVGLGREHFSMNATHLVIETTQGDSRDVGLGSWVIKRKTRQGFEFYPVEAEVIEDDYEALP